MSIRPILLVAGLLAAGRAGVAQQPQRPAQPLTEHRRLEFFVGTWTLDSLEPGTTYREACEWFAGSFHVVCRSERRSPTGTSRGLSILGYAPEEQAYTYYGIDSSGRTEPLRGRYEGGRWVFTGETRSGDRVTRSRATIEPTPDGFRFTAEEATDGAPWQTAWRGKYLRLGS